MTGSLLAVVLRQYVCGSGGLRMTKAEDDIVQEYVGKLPLDYWQ